MFTVFYFVAIIAFVYFLMIMPDNKRKKRFSNLISNLKTNDEIICKGGIMGKILLIEEDFVIIESGPDKTTIKLNKIGILNILVSKEIVGDLEPINQEE